MKCSKGDKKSDRIMSRNQAKWSIKAVEKNQNSLMSVCGFSDDKSDRRECSIEDFDLISHQLLLTENS